MLEDLGLRGYTNFWHAVPSMADSLERSDDVRLLGFTGSATIGSHDATFHSLLVSKRKRRRIRVLLLSPLAIDEMLERRKVTMHPPESYVRRILGTIENLHWLRREGFIDARVRLYRHDPQWYFWVFADCAVIDSHALGVGRRSPRMRLSRSSGTGPPEELVQLFENAWDEPGNREVDFDRYDDDIRALRADAESLLQRGDPTPELPPPWTDLIVPSVWNVRCETYPSPTLVLSQLRLELEDCERFCYFGATGESRFGRRSADFAAGLVAGEDGTCHMRISLISPQSAPALRDKLRVSLSGRDLEGTREAIGKTLQVLDSLKDEYRLDLQVRLRERLGSARLYLFDRVACLSSFEPVEGAPSPCILFRETNQDFLVDLFRRCFDESWKGSAGTEVVEPSAPTKDGDEARRTQRPPAIVFDAQKFLLTIDGTSQRLSRGVLLFLLATAHERGAYLPLDQDVDGRPARRRRAELGARIGHAQAKAVIETVAGLGYRFQPCVRVVGTGQVRGINLEDIDRVSGPDDR